MALLKICFCLLGVLGIANSQTCNATSGVNTYTCSYTSWASPPATASFTGTVQKIYVTDVNGTLGSSVFSGVALARSSLSSRTKDAFVVDCVTPQGQIDLSASNTFQGLESMSELYFRLCRIGNLPSRVFSAFGNLSHLEFYKDVITSIQADAFSGLAFKSDLTSGNLTFDNSQIINGTLPDGLFSPIVNLRHLSLKNAGLTAFQKNLIERVYTLSSIDISGNLISTLDSKIFDGIPITTFVAQANHWECTCDNVWIFNWVTWNRIDMNAAMTCETPAHWEDIRLYTYNVTVCAEGPGVDPLDVIIGTFLFIALALALAALVMSCVIKKHLSNKKRVDDDLPDTDGRWFESDDDELLIDNLAPDSRPVSALSVDREDHKLALLMNLQKRPATGTRKETHLRGPLEITTTTEESEAPAENGVVGMEGSDGDALVSPIET